MQIHVKRREDEWRVYPGAERFYGEATEDRRLIWIPAVPSSGTSLIAGVLHALGVNMGNVGSVNQRRGYAMYEDLDMGFFTFSPNAPLDSLVNQRIRLREYINYRFHKEDGPVGVKTLPTAWIYDKDPASLPVKTVEVHRPTEDAQRADQERMASRPDRDPAELPATAFQHMNRYGGVAAMAWARDQLRQFIEPSAVVDFYAFLDDPQAEMEKLCAALELAPSPRQVMAAMLLVEPERVSRD